MNILTGVQHAIGFTATCSWNAELSAESKPKRRMPCFEFVTNAKKTMSLCNDQRNAQVFNLLIYLLPPYMFRALTPYAGDLNQSWSCTAASEGGLTESLKHLKQKKTNKQIKTLCITLVTAHWSLHIGHCTLVTAHWSLHIGHCTLVTAHCSLHIGHSTLVTAHWSLHIGQSTLFTAHWSLHIGHCTLVTAHWSLHIGHCTLVTAHWSLHIGHCT
jgi:hypothetical protein